MRGEFSPPCQAFCSAPADKLQVRKFFSKSSDFTFFQHNLLHTHIFPNILPSTHIFLTQRVFQWLNGGTDKLP